jgi:DNA-binding Lrp family transcriptional regulator
MGEMIARNSRSDATTYCEELAPPAQTNQAGFPLCVFSRGAGSGPAGFAIHFMWRADFQRKFLAGRQFGRLSTSALSHARQSEPFEPTSGGSVLQDLPRHGSSHQGPQTRIRLRARDRKILAILQDDGRIANNTLASKLGISNAPCFRRVQALKDAGYIRGYRALLDAERMGFQITAFAFVTLTRQSRSAREAFEHAMLAWPNVRECYALSGEIDFVLKCVDRDATGFLKNVLEPLTRIGCVASVRTSFAIRASKLAHAVPFADDFETPTPAQDASKGTPP